MAEREFERPARSQVDKRPSGYNEEIDRARGARNTQKNDTNPMMEKEGFLGVDDLDRMRRRKIR